MPPEGAAAPAGWRSQTPLPLLELGAHRGGYLPLRSITACSSLPPEGAAAHAGGARPASPAGGDCPCGCLLFRLPRGVERCPRSGWPGLGWPGGSPWAPRSQASFGSLLARLRSSCICKGVGWPGFCMRIIRLTFVPSVTESATPLPNDFANKSELPSQPVSVRKAKGG